MRILSLALALSIATPVLAITEKHIPDNGGPPRVYEVHSYYESAPYQAGLDDRISVHVQNFSQLLAKANEGKWRELPLDFFEQSPANDAKTRMRNRRRRGTRSGLSVPSMRGMLAAYLHHRL